MSAPQTETGLKRDALGVAGVTFLVLAAVAPLTGIVVVASITMALGNGGGAPAAFIIIAAILLLFSVGYAQMSKEVVNAGGFYAFVVRGLGRTGGLIAGLIAALGYNFFVVGTIGTSGFFMQIVIYHMTGFYLNWYIWGLLSIILSFLMARRGIDFSSRILGVCLVIEVCALIVFNFAVLFQTGFDFHAFSITSITSGSLPIGLLIAATGFLGFEAAALFSEESRNPNRTIPRALYTAIILIGLILGITSWAVASAIGIDQTKEVAMAHLADGDLFFSLFGQYVGKHYIDIVQILLLISLYAAMMAFHNSATRYLFALGRTRVLPPVLARTRSNGMPQVAGIVQAAFAALVALGFFAAGADPMTTIVPAMLGFGTLAIIVLQALAALSITVYFRRKGSPRLWKTFVAPGIAFICLTVITIMVVLNFDVISGSDALAIQLLPLLIVLAVIGGLIYGPYLKARKPDVYDGLHEDLEQFQTD